MKVPAFLIEKKHLTNLGVRQNVEKTILIYANDIKYIIKSMSCNIGVKRKF